MTPALPTLRPYQAEAIAQLTGKLHERPILTMPTGAGKTVTAAALVRELQLRTLWLAHRRELIQQAARSLRDNGLRCGIIMAGQAADRKAHVQVASIQTLARRTLPDVDLVVMDECHHARASTYRQVLDHYQGRPVVGLTATPFRLDGKGLGDIFGSIVVACYPDELCQDGTLVEPIVYAPATPDLSGVKVVHGEFREGDVFAAMSKTKITGDIVKTWFQRGCSGGTAKRTVCFAVNVAHSNKIVEAFKEAGVRAEHLDGGTCRTMRDAILHRLKIGYTHVVSQCMVLTEGWDLPALEVAIIARPTASLCLHLQMLGRVMRSAPEKLGAIVLDHAGNHLRHGTVIQRLDYSLEDDVHPKARDKDPEASPGRRCPDCYLLVDPGTPECPECGHQFKPSLPEERPGELVAFSDAARLRPSIEAQRAAWESLEWRRKRFGYREGWSFHRFVAMFGFKPLVVDSQLVEASTATPDQKRRAYEQLLFVAESKGYKPGWAGYQFKAMFGQWPRFARRERSA